MDLQFINLKRCLNTCALGEETQVSGLPITWYGYYFATFYAYFKASFAMLHAGPGPVT